MIKPALLSVPVTLGNKRKIRLGNTAVVLGAAFVLTAAFSFHPYVSAVLSRMYLAAMMAAGLDLCAGVAGQLSLGQGAFMALGAYPAAMVMLRCPTPAGIAAGILTGAAAGCLTAFLLGRPILRLTGDYLSMATVGIGEMTRIFFENNAFFGGSGGILGIPRFTNPMLCYVFLVCSTLFCLFMVKTDLGLFCKALSCDQKAADSCGVPVLRVKTAAFCISGTICAAAGALYAGLTGYVSPEDFTFLRSVDIVAAVVLGGPGTIIGPVAAALFLEAAGILLQSFGSYRMILYGLLLVTAGVLRYRKSGKRL